MTWVAINKDDTEIISSVMPIRYDEKWDCYMEIFYDYEPDYIDVTIKLPKGSIKKLIGKDLTWNDRPVELKED